VSDYTDWRPDPIPAGWRLLDSDRRDQLGRELAAELTSGHPLFGLVLTPVAGCIGCDDTLVFVEDETRWAIVHPTWRGSAEPPPWPNCEVFDAALPRDEMTEHAEHVDTTEQ